MPTTSQFVTLITKYLRARIPFVSIRTNERPRALEILKSTLVELGLPAYVHTMSQGMRDLATSRVVSEDRSPVGAMDFISQQILSRQNLTFILTEVKELADDTPTARQMADLVMLAVERGVTLVAVSSESTWTPLQRLGVSLSLDPPDQDEMVQILHENVDPYRGRLAVDWSEDDFRQAASILAGVTRVEAENIIATILAGGAVRKADLAELSQSKDRLFSDISGLERVKLREQDGSVGGLAGLQAWLERERPLLMADLRERGMRPPRGVLLVGVPGCGKSLSAKFISASWNLPLYRLDLANIHGMFLGQSESRLKEALNTADHLAPCVLWIDEIEKGLAGAGSSSDGGSATRLVGHFLFWLQEARERVFVVATANNVSQLPPELLRRGRFDELFFVDLPTPEERRAIIELYVRRNLRAKLPDALMAELVQLSEGFAGADIEAGVREVAKDAIIKGDASITADTFRMRFENIVPLSQTSPEQIDAIRAWGRERAVPASGKPVASSGGAPSSRRLVIV